jgi:hypothetical protein
LTQQERDLGRQQHQQVRLTELSANIEDLCQAIRAGLQTLDFSGRRKIIELLIDRVIISHADIEIRYAIPLTGLSPTGKKETLRLPYRAVLWLAGTLSPPVSGLRTYHSLQ